MKNIKPWLWHLLPVFIFFILTSIYFSPLYTGKSLVQSDNIQFEGTMSELNEYRKKGEEIRWTNTEFSGMPIAGGSEYNLYSIIDGVLFYSVMPKPIMMMMALFIGFYILGCTMTERKWLAAIFSFAFAFSTFNVISLEAGHDNKVVAMALMAPVLAGIIRAYRGEKILGGLITAFFAGYQLHYGHIQITYYLLLMVVGYVVYIAIKTYQNGAWRQFIRSSGVLLIATIIAVGCNFGKLYALYEYSTYSTRGGSELSANDSGSGLDKDYALAWSNGVLEPFTIMFPYFYGGASSGEQLDQGSAVYQQLSGRGVDRRSIENITSSAPLYWGDQPFTAGPIYYGAVICFLMIFALFYLRDGIKWWALAFLAISLLLSMGKNLEWYTDLFFYYVPLYNKFRSVTMIMSMGQLLAPLLGLMAVDKLITSDNQWSDIKQSLLQSIGVMTSIGLFFLMFKSSFFDFEGQNDGQYGFPDWLLNALISDRKQLFNQDIYRTLILTLLAGGAVWLLTLGKLKRTYFTALIAVLVLFDMWLVNKRYLKSDDFDRKARVTQNAFTPSAADLAIQRDTTYYRVLNLTTNPFSDGITSYHHFSVGGYSAIKMQRYQELIDRYLSQVDAAVLGMLNAKYFIVPSQQGGPGVQRNTEALGNAWLVKTARTVANADEEIAAIGEVDLRKIAVYDQKFDEYLGGGKAYDQSGSITLTSYHPEHLVYGFDSETEQLAVFSDIYYLPGWNAYIDGEQVDYIRVNYLLRGLSLPAGSHKVEFKYEPVSQVVGNVVVSGSGICLLLILLLSGYRFMNGGIKED